MAKINIKNRTIFTRDNLEVMRGINSTSIDLIYLDPPFNKNKKFIAPTGTKAEGASFDDIFKKADIKDEWLVLIEHKHKDIFEFINGIKLISKGDYNWCYITYMAIRLLECHRILKDTGSLYLHCDSTMSHYLKLLLDCIFGERNFRNEIIWQRHTSSQRGSQHKPTHWGHTTETILFYAKSSKAQVLPYRKFTEEELAEKFPLKDVRGRYYDDSAHIWRNPNMGARPNLCYKWRGFKNPYPSGWRLSKERLEEEYQKGNIVILPNGKLQRRKYQEDWLGTTAGSLWTDINPAQGKERTGYPTQKPLALLERIVKASSNKGDVILDPFCGCATTCVASEVLERKWIGIDISPKAYQLVNDRLTDPKQLGMLTNAWKFKGDIIQRTDIPTRTDQPIKIKYNYKQMRRKLFIEQNSKCALCRTEFDDEQHLEVDHFYPKSLGGTDNIENRQLLCGRCNKIKSNKSMEEAILEARRRGLIEG